MRSLQFAVGFFLGFIGFGSAEDEDLPGIAEVGIASGEFDTLFDAITAAGLADALDVEGPLTVFGPTDTAFADPNVDTSAFDADPISTLLYHVVDGLFAAEDLMDGTVLTNFLASPLYVCVTPSGGRRINGIPVTIPDLFGSNGVIHGIGGIIPTTFVPDGTCEDFDVGAVTPAPVTPAPITPAPISAPPVTPAPVGTPSPGSPAATCEEAECNKNPDTGFALQFTTCEVIGGEAVCSCEYSEELGDVWPICFGPAQDCTNPVFDCTNSLCFNWCETKATDFCAEPPCCEASGCGNLICNEAHRVNGPQSRCTCPEGFEYYSIDLQDDPYTTAAGCRSTNDTMPETPVPAPTPAPVDMTPSPVEMTPSPVDMVDSSAAPSGAPDPTPMPVDDMTTDPPTGSAGIMHASSFLDSVLFAIILGIAAIW